MNGETYDPIRDGERLRGHLLNVWRAMLDHQWHRLSDLALMTGASEASVSARLRDLRKPEYGSFTVDRRYIHRGLWEYRLARPGDWTTNA